MGIGNVTTEELVYDEKGRLLNDGTWEYKPPCSKTIPQVTLHSQALVICNESSTCMTFVMQLCSDSLADTFDRIYGWPYPFAGYYMQLASNPKSIFKH